MRLAREDYAYGASRLANREEKTSVLQSNAYIACCVRLLLNDKFFINLKFAQ